MTKRKWLSVGMSVLLGCGSESQGAGTNGPQVETSGVAAAPAKAPTKAASRGPERTIFSFVDNRLLAHRVTRSQLLLAPGSLGFAKYVRFGARTNPSDTAWDIGAKQGSLPVAVLKGKSGEVNVPLTAALAGSTTVSALLFNPGATQMMVSLSVNGQKDKARNLVAAPGWSTIAFPVTNALREGENELQFFTGAANVAFAEIAIGGTLPAASGLPTARPALISGSDGLQLPQGAGVAYYVKPPTGALITADLEDGACSLAVAATGENGKVSSGTLTGLGSGVALADVAGGFARIEFTASGCARVIAGNLRMVLPGETPKAERGNAPKYVMLWVMDSLRADRVRALEPTARAESPIFSELAKTAAVFTRFYVQGNESRTSHASLWTSLYPVVHRMIGDAKTVDLKWTSIDEVAKKAGLGAFGVSGNGYVRPARGFGSAWDAFKNSIEDELPVSGEALLKRFMETIADPATKAPQTTPWFGYLGTIDTHVSWRGRQPWLGQYSPDYSGRFAREFTGKDAADAATKKTTLTDAEKKHVRAIYDSNVSYQDKLLGEFIDSLKAAGIWDHTMLIITADHGDEQWEDGRVGHGASTLDTLIRVPLVIHYPPMVKAGVYGEGAESVDVVPTVADALGVAVDPHWQGQSLIPLTQGQGAGYDRISFNSNAEGTHAVRMGNWKVRLSGSSDPRVFHMTGKGELAGEQTDLFGDKSAAIPARALLDAAWIFRTWNREWKKATWGNAANVTSKFAADVSAAAE